MGAVSTKEQAGLAFEEWARDPVKFVRDVFHVDPDPWQIDVLTNYVRRERVAMKASKGVGKAQPKETRIWTPDGEVRFGDLRVGSRVFAGDGSITTVRAVYDRGVRPVFRVSFDDGTSTLACGEHLWKVRGAAERVRKHAVPYQRETQSDEIWSVLSTDQIIARGVRNKNGKWSGRQFEIPRQGAAQFPFADLPVDPYVIGVWLGDGVRLSSRYATKPTVEIEQEINRRGYLTSGESDGVVSVYGLLLELRGLRLAETYSHQRFIPAQYKTASVQQRSDLLRGLMDTDGEIGKDNGSMGFATTSRQLADDVAWLARSLGGTAVEQKTKKPFYYGDEWQKIHGRDCYRLTLRLPFNPFLVPHRRERWKDPARSASTIRYMTRKIDAIEPEGEADCMCIEVAHPEHLYLTNDFIVTHNTAVESWCIWHFLATRPYCKIACTAIDGNNLRDNLWTELALWRSKSDMLMAMFDWTKTRISHRMYPETWWCSARTWPKTADANAQSNTLAGLHAEHIMFVLDESGGMPSAIMASAEAALSSCVEGHIIQAGNPTHLSGPLYDACTRERRLWHVVTINGDPDDPRRSSRVKKQWARDQIEKYGRDNPWVKVNVFGEFPPSSLNALIGPDEVEAAMKRMYRQHEIAGAPRVLGCDIARFGDDASVIFKRQGLQSWPMLKYRNIDSIQGAGIVARTWQDWNVDACFLDASGGYGSGWEDQLRRLRFAPIPIYFSGKAHDEHKFYNKRAEMYWDAVEWIKHGGALPPSPELLAALTQTTYCFKGDRILLEDKEQVKDRIGYSPDEADAFVLTFAEPVLKKQTGVPAARARHHEEYNPYREGDADGYGQNPYD